MTRVLVVADGSRIREPMVEEFERAGFEVRCCVGPQAPDFVCDGVRCSMCGLAESSDVIVLDGWLASDEARQGVPSWHLLLSYRSMRIPVVALIGGNGFPGPVLDPGIRTIARDADAEEIVMTVAELIEEEERR